MLFRSTDPNERQFADGKNAGSVPSSAEAMEEAFVKSDIHSRTIAEKNQYKQYLASHSAAADEFRLAVQEQKSVISR